MTTRTREDLVADMERFATSLPGVMAADAQVALIVPGNLTDEETQRVAAAVPEGARISVFTDATRAGWSNGKKIVWGQNDGGLHDWRRATTVGDGPVATFTVSMHDVLDAWRSKYVVYNEDGDGHYTDTPDTVEEAIIIAAANQLAMSVKGEYIKTIVGETVRSLVAQLAAGDIREWVTEALQRQGGSMTPKKASPARRGSPVAKPIPLDSSDDDLAASVRRTFDADGFFDALDAVRVQHQLTWRKVGEAAGVAPSTLTRMSQGRRPDVDSLAALVQWSGLRADDYLVGAVRQPAAERSGLEALTAHFRADPSLSPEAADILHDLVLNAYETLRKDR